MPSTSSIIEQFDNLVSTTMSDYSDEVYDAVSKHNALYRKMAERGNVVKLSGGRDIRRTIEYAENGTYQRYSGFDILNIQDSQVLTDAVYPWRQIAVNVVSSGLELRANSGKAEMIDLAEAKIKNAQHTFANNMATDMYSDGTLPNQINGLQALISDTGTGTVGNINSAVDTWWKNYVQSNAAPIQGGGAVTIGATTIEDMWNNLYMEMERGIDKPDLIVASNDVFNYFERSQASLKRYTKADKDADAGFINLMYKGAEVLHDGGSRGGGILPGHAYFINTKYLQLIVHKDANFTRSAQKASVNQDAIVIPFLWQGNLVTTNRSMLGVHHA